MNYYFITGPSRGIGKALAELLLNRPDSAVIGVSRHSTITHERYTHVPLDLSDRLGVENNLHKVFPLVPDATKLVVVNNAAVLGDIGYMGECSNEHFDFVLDVNLGSVAMLMNTFLKTYSTHPAAKIILNISSGAGKNPIDGWAAYCASKAGLDMLSRCTALEQERRGTGTRVFSLSPGVVDTDMQADIRQASEHQFSAIQRFKEYHQRKELQQPQEVARRIALLLDSPEAYQEVILNLPA